MGFGHGTVEVGPDEAVLICSVPEAGVKLRNTGNAILYVGGPGVEAEGANAGYPIDPGTMDVIKGPALREAPQVPAPPGDMTAPTLYGRSGSGIIKVAWIAP
jgi:hypothetical protein